MEPEFLQAQEDIQTRFDNLPQELMDLIVGGTLDAVVFGIEDTYKLTQEQVTSLENEIILVLSLFVSPSEFVDNVQESLGVERPIAEAIGKEVATEIFDPVDDILAFAEGKRSGDQTGEAQPQNIIDKKQELTRLAEQFARPRVATPSVEEVVENSAENVTPLRTMQGDMNRIHGYGAYNEALERGEDATQTHVSNQGDILGK